MFRKAVCIIMAVFSLSTSVAYASTIKTITSETVSDVAAPYIETESAIIVDVKTGQQLYGKNIYEKQYPASITKIMTCTLALENLDISKQITFSKEAVDIEVGSSAAYVVEGEVVGIKDCLYGLMIHSCNDFANGLAEAVSGDLAAFSALMTSKAKELGCTNTNFTNAHGLDDENHYTCAYDMALIGVYAYKTQAVYRDIIQQDRYQVEPTNMCDETRYWKNGNELILDDGYYYYEPCIGGKTGYTEIAQYTLVTYANINGRELICVMLRAPSKAVAMEETTLLYEYIEENVSIEYYAEIDKVYEEEQKELESKEEASKEAAAQAKSDNNGKKSNSKDSDKDGMPIWLKVIITVLIILLAYYVYLRYKLHLKRKRRRERRRRREMARRRQMQERYRQTRFYQENNENYEYEEE